MRCGTARSTSRRRGSGSSRPPVQDRRHRWLRDRYVDGGRGRAPTARTVDEAGGLAGSRISTVCEGGVLRFTAAAVQAWGGAAGSARPAASRREWPSPVGAAVVLSDASALDPEDSPRTKQRRPQPRHRRRVPRPSAAPDCGAAVTLLLSAGEHPRSFRSGSATQRDDHIGRSHWTCTRTSPRGCRALQPPGSQNYLRLVSGSLAT
jgi:hypothetical protein